MSPNNIFSSSFVFSDEESSSNDILNTPSLGERTWCLWRREDGEGVAVAAAVAGPNGNACVDESGAVRGPSSYANNVCCHVLPLVGVAGGVNPSASVMSSQIGKVWPLATGEVMAIGAERERFIADCVRPCPWPRLLLLDRGTGTALDETGVGVLGAG